MTTVEAQRLHQRQCVHHGLRGWPLVHRRTRGGYTHLQGDTNQDVTATQRRLYNRQDSRLPWSTNYKQRSPLWNFTRRQLHQRHTTRSQPTQSNAGGYTRSNSRSNNFHYNKRGRRAIYPISKNMPNTRAWSESYSGLNTQPDLSFAVKELAGSLQQATSWGQAASPTLQTIRGRYIDSQVCDTTKNTTYINKCGTPWPERVHGSRLGWLSRCTKEHDRFRDPIFGYASALCIPYPGRGSILISGKWVLCRRYRSNRECT